MTIYDTREGARLALSRERQGHWNRWGPYLAERAWGTVREDCSADGRRAVFGSCELFNTDPHWRDLIPFHEYFHGDTGRGCGASRQTGWTGLIAQILINLEEEWKAPSRRSDQGGSTP